MNRAQGMVSLINNIFFKVIILAKNLKHTRALLPQNRIQLKKQPSFSKFNASRTASFPFPKLLTSIFLRQVFGGGGGGQPPTHSRRSTRRRCLIEHSHAAQAQLSSTAAVATVEGFWPSLYIKAGPGSRPTSPLQSG